MPRPARIFFLRISLRGIPSVWRGITVPATVRLSALHNVLQAVMGWQDSHLHEFTARNGERFGFADEDDFDPPQDEKLHKLEEFLEKPRDKLRYTYDFGDSWEHVIELKLVAEYPQRPTRAEFIEGAGACPPEDCGGVPGYYEMLKAIHDPTHPEHDQFINWLPDGTYDPNEFDQARVKRLLQSIRV